MTTVEVLRAAKAELQRRGWMQNPPARDDNSPCCAAQALNIYETFSNEFDSFDALQMALGIKTDGNTKWLADWNDALGRTVDEVLAAFDKAIALAESRP